MNFLIDFLICSIFATTIAYWFKKNNILIHNVGEFHQSFIKSNPTPLAGGIIIFFYILVHFKSLSPVYIFPFLILLTGIFSDSKTIKSAYFRLFIQFILVVLFISIYNLNLNSTRIIFLDEFLRNYYFSVFFTSLCVLIIINGTNFIDGSNLLTIGYFVILEIAFLHLKNKGILLDNNIFSFSLLPVLIVIFIFNSFNKIYLGDAGSYLLGFIYSFKCISLYLTNNDISPFFIVLILWYPGFEIFFSILRKLNFNRSPIKPDSNHLHQLIYLSLYKKINKNEIRSNLVGLIINTFNLSIFFFSLKDIYNSQYQIILLLISISVYVFIYVKLLRSKLKNKF